MKFSAKKIGKKLGVLAAENHKDVESQAKDIAKFIVSSEKTSKLSEIIRHFKSSYNKETGTVDVTIFSAHKDHVPHLKEIAGMKTEVKEVIDPTLLGGIRIEMEDFMIDGSIKSKISKIRNVAGK